MIDHWFWVPRVFSDSRPEANNWEFRYLTAIAEVMLQHNFGLSSQHDGCFPGVEFHEENMLMIVESHLVSEVFVFQLL